MLEHQDYQNTLKLHECQIFSYFNMSHSTHMKILVFTQFTYINNYINIMVKSSWGGLTSKRHTNHMVGDFFQNCQNWHLPKLPCPIISKPWLSVMNMSWWKPATGISISTRSTSLPRHLSVHVGWSYVQLKGGWSYVQLLERIPFVDHILYTVVNQTKSYDPKESTNKNTNQILENTWSGQTTSTPHQ